MAGVIMSRKMSRKRVPDVHLDELLRFDDATASLLDRTQAGSKPWVLRSAIQTFVVSAVVYTAFHVVNLAPPYALIVAVCVGAVLVRQAARAASEPSWQRTADLIRPPGGPRGPSTGGGDGDNDGIHNDNDGMLSAVHRWDRRLEWGTTGADRFRSGVAPRLGELADERLRQRHAITRAVDPVRARRLLGEEVWTLLHGRRDRVPTARELAAALSRLESL
jgi:hypothetical protein